MQKITKKLHTDTRREQ